MAWHGIRGHDAVVEKFRLALGRGRLASSFLFAGPAGIGKRTFALKLAQAMLCQQRPEEVLDPCETCQSCAMALAGTHPDIEIVSKPRDGATIPLELFIGDMEHRGREGLCYRLSMRPFLGGRRVAVIDDADLLSAGKGDCTTALLKTLEEPPPRSVLILIGTSPAKQLPTIRSRCQLIRFSPLAGDVVAELLVSQGLVSDPAEARRLAAYAEGSVQRAVELADGELWAFRRTLLGQLAAGSLPSVAMSQSVSAFADEAGKEASARRGRLRQIVAFAADFYRQLLHAKSGAEPPADADLRGLLDQALRQWPGDSAAVAACLDRCLETQEQIDRNANQTTLIEAWLDDLAGVGLGS